MRLTPPHEIAIGILADEFADEDFPEPRLDPRTSFGGREGALEFLRGLTEEDFGADVARWRAWFRDCPADLLALHYDEWRARELIRTRPERLAGAENMWGHVTRRRCPACGGLCPEYRARCAVCEYPLGRAVP